MKKATVVIGSGFGDEGKGLVTDYFASKLGPDTIVVRFNGGAQAGHTIQSPEGERHVFSHFSAGTLTGATTFLSKYFIINPILFEKERAELQRYVTAPKVLVDWQSYVTLPFDMMINHIAEQARGNDKHGSCGIGIFETVVRNNTSFYNFSIGHLNKKWPWYWAEIKLRAFLRDVRNLWVPQRLKELNIELTKEIEQFLDNKELIEQWIVDIFAFRDFVEICDEVILHNTDNVIFEGAQGLQLDTDYGQYPFVTGSNTSLKNVINIVKKAGIEELDVIYVSRVYSTRHGNGPLPHELTDGTFPFHNTMDESNKENFYQGKFRYAYLDLDVLNNAISYDLKYLGKIKANIILAITCVDQCNSFTYYMDGIKKWTDDEVEFFRDIVNKTGINSLLISRGPTRQTISKINILESI